ncbi:MAG: YdcF family protein, partial [Rhizobiaceae bacterium]
STDALQKSTIALREWIGLVAYWLAGRIDSPFPG